MDTQPYASLYFMEVFINLRAFSCNRNGKLVQPVLVEVQSIDLESLLWRRGDAQMGKLENCQGGFPLCLHA